MMRHRTMGILFGAALTWFGGMAYFATLPSSESALQSALAADPPTSRSPHEKDDISKGAASRMQRLLDGIRPSKVLRRDADAKSDIIQTSATSAAVTSHEQAELTNPYPVPAELMNVELLRQTPEQAHAKSWGCVECHKGSHDPHAKGSLSIGCTDCHGGNAQTVVKDLAHISPRYPDAWCSSANPVRSYTLLNHECPEFIRFVNPGDLRIAHLSCGTAGCHPTETLQVKKGMMTHGCMLWGAALYNNGAVPHKQSRYGESYSMYGTPQRVQTVPAPTRFEQDYKGVVPFLEPLPRFQVTQPGNTLRIFERGGRGIVEIGIPDRLEESGRPRVRLSDRGFGTINRTDPVYIGLQKTRLLDPTLNFLGTNDHAGDYRSSGCTSCHMIYANDRSPVHSGPFAKYGNRGTAAAAPDDFVISVDPTIPKDEPGHPIAHRFTSAIPTSQCVICHMHPGTTVLQSYLGYMWSDQDTDAEVMYPGEAVKLTAEEFDRAQASNPNDIDAKTRFVDPEELANATDLNPQLKHQLADFHGHGWSFRAVFKKDREGNLLDHNGNPLGEASYPQKKNGLEYPLHAKSLYRNINWREAGAVKRVMDAEEQLRKSRDGATVHMLDIHLEKGMHCVDCHFVQDAHGDGKLYGDVRSAIEITCTDCHGTVAEFAPLKTSGPAAQGNIWQGMVTQRQDADGKDIADVKDVGRNLAGLRTPFGKRRFETLPDGTIIQNSMVEPELSWRVTQVKDTITPSHPDYNALSALSKTVRLEVQNNKYEFAWGDIPVGDGGKPDEKKCAHAIHSMNCITCHSAWNPSCFGCHLPQKANMKKPDLHNEGDLSRNYTAYCFQTLRDDVYMIAKDGNSTGNRINPVRSACAVHVSSYNAQRESIYYQQQTISGEGLSGISFSTNVPHTVRGKGETKMCTDCHLSSSDDNNAIMAQLLMHGTNYTNFIGRYLWVAAGEHGVWSPIVQTRDEPQAVIGSTLHAAAYPEEYKKHVENGYQLDHAHEHPGKDISDNVFHPKMKHEVLALQHRGEYLYAACGEAGFRIYDIAFTDDKAFSERYTTAPVSPLGQKFYVRTPYCTDVASPTTIAPDPTRQHKPENFEAPVPMMYAFIYVTDLHEGLILVGAGTLLDGDPNNNFVKKDVCFNPDGILCGARAITIYGKYAYICCDAGIAIVDISDHKNLRVVNIMREGEMVHHPHNIEFQFRYGFICDEHGVKVIDVTNPEEPVEVSHLEMDEVHNIYIARTYAYVAAGHHGLVILDVKNPKDIKVDQIFDAGGCIHDLHDVKLGINYASQFAYLADGENGVHVVQLTSPQTPGNDGFSPRPTPMLVASFKIPHEGHALALSEGVDRDRAIDEAGNQIAVFGRVGARPLNLEEQQRLYLAPNTGTSPGKAPPSPWTVADPKRDFSVKSWRQREVKLHQAIEEWYGPNGLSKRK